MYTKNMSRYVPDISTHRWVIIAADRENRPDNEHEEIKHDKCVFCAGQEKITSEEVFRIGEGGANEPGWKVRVIKNKYPITDIHEVFVHSPDHDRDIENLHVSQIENILQAYKARFNTYTEAGQVLIFCNHGKHAGASMPHPHSQMVVLPTQINIDTLLREPLQHISFEDKYFTVYCPDFSQWSYEAWVAPKQEDTMFGEITNDAIASLATIMKRVTKRLEDIYESQYIYAKVDKNTHPFGYNYYIYPRKNWYLRIIPRFIHRAGFELGTGLSVNIVDPIKAAVELGK